MVQLFLYGTLMAHACHPVARTLHARLSAGVPARVAGRLYAVPDAQGWYPALVPGAGWVRGQLYVGDLTPEDWARIDAWEGYDPAASDAGDYARVAMTVEPRDGGEGQAVAAHVYAWIAPLPAGAVPIPEGDFTAWLRRIGGRAFGE